MASNSSSGRKERPSGRVRGFGNSRTADEVCHSQGVDLDEMTETDMRDAR